MVTTLTVVGAIGGVAAYVTNFQGFKDWVDSQVGGGGGGCPAGSHYDSNGVCVPDNDGGGGGGGDDKPEPEKAKEVGKPVGSTWNCISYPRCNTQVSGTDARKKCCCDNKCALMKKPNQTMSPKMNLSTGLCLCNFKTKSTLPTKCLGPCPSGQTPGIVNGRCGCKACTPCKAPCYVRSTGCSCKLNENALFHNDGVCTMSCGGRACHYNFPCGGKTKVKVCVNGGCAQAKTAWLAKYGCKSRMAQAYQSFDRYDSSMERVPSIA